MLSNSTSASVTSLRTLNPYVSNALDTHISGGSIQPWMPRLDGAAPLRTAADQGLNTGCSAFAFQVTRLLPACLLYYRISAEHLTNRFGCITACKDAVTAVTAIADCV